MTSKNPRTEFQSEQRQRLNSLIVNLVETNTHPFSNLNEGADQSEAWRSALLQRPGPPTNPTQFLLVSQSQSTQNALSPFNGGKAE